MSLPDDATIAEHLGVTVAELHARWDADLAELGDLASNPDAARRIARLLMEAGGDADVA